jgi:tripartite ATP-independent transporter DctP family solute receptor
MRRGKFLTLFCLGAWLLTSLPGCKEVRKYKSIKLAHGLDVTHSVHKAMEYLAARVEEKSGGQLRVEIFPNQQLGTERESIELLQIGSVGMTKVAASVMENFAPNTKVLSLPYLFRDKEHQFAVLDGPIGQNLLTQGEKFWLRGLTYYDAGSRSFYTKGKPINTPEDLEGLKIRVLESKTAMNMVSSLGGSPTPISWGELYTSLQQGVVDGAENNAPSFFLSRHYEVCKYYSLNEHTFLPDILLISTVVWENLEPQEQKWLQEAADESKVYQRKLWVEAEQEALEAVRAAGVEINYPDKAPFAAQVEPMYQTYRDEPEVARLIDQIRAVQ